MQQQAENVVRELISPLLEADGASIEVVEVRNGVIRVRFGGAYRGCPSAPFTFDGIVVPALKGAMGDIRVELVP